jgi:hypothetical protein
MPCLPKTSRRGFVAAFARLALILAMPALALEADTAAAQQQDRSPFTGVWKEFWSPDTTTDVNYNDEYAVGVDAVGRPKVLMLSRNQSIFDDKIDGQTISFTLQTSFLVKYSLKLREDGTALDGTAETPNKTVKIRWERIR